MTQKQRDERLKDRQDQLRALKYRQNATEIKISEIEKQIRKLRGDE